MAITKIVQNEQKFRELILYLADKSETDPSFGAVKLNKLLFYIDFHFYARTGKPVTGMQYMKLENGPVPRRMKPTQDAMISAKALHIREESVWGAPHARHRYMALRPANLDKFTAVEIAWIDQVIDAFWEQSGEAVSNLSHQTVGWQAVPLKQTIPYNAVFVSNEPPTDYERERGRQLARQHRWAV